MKKLELNKYTVATLTEEEQVKIKAGYEKQEPCWVNLWTLYYCGIYYTEPRAE